MKYDKNDEVDAPRWEDGPQEDFDCQDLRWEEQVGCQVSPGLLSIVIVVLLSFLIPWITKEQKNRHLIVIRSSLLLSCVGKKRSLTIGSREESSQSFEMTDDWSDHVQEKIVTLTIIDIDNHHTIW